MSRRRNLRTQEWIDEGPRPSQGTGVGWPIGADSGQTAARVNAIDFEQAPGAMVGIPGGGTYVPQPEGLRPARTES